MFEDLLVIDAASYVAGPAAATVMADYGANVVKVEPLQGDAYRGLAARYRTNYNWLLTSRNKRSIGIDVRLPEGQELLHKLVAKADVLIVNFNLAQLEKYRLNFETLKAINPRLVLAQITGYGNRGPEAQRRAFDVAAWWARTGIMDMMKAPGGKPPIGAGGVGDHASAMTLFGAIMMALYRREKTGKGTFVSTSLAANGVWSMGMHVQGMIAGYDPTELLKEKGYSPFTLAYETRDEGFVMLVGANPTREWPLLCKALGKPEMVDDPRFPDLRSVMRQRQVVCDVFAEQFKKLTTAQAMLALDEVDATYSLIEPLKDVVTDAQLIENEIIRATGDSDPDYQFTVNSPFELADEQKVPIQRAPEIGSHTNEILNEIGMDESAIKVLQDKGVIR